MLKLHVVLAVDRAGLVGEDGETHHGVFDVGFLRHAPGMTLLAPSSCKELKDMLRWAVKDCNGPVAVRYPRGGDGAFCDSQWDANATVVTHRTGKDAVIVTYGNLLNNAMSAADLLAEQGVEISVVRLTRLAPVDFTSLKVALSGIENVIFAEEASAGIGESIASVLCNGHKVTCLDLGREYVTHGSVAQLHRAYGLDAASLAEKVKEVLHNEN